MRYFRKWTSSLLAVIMVLNLFSFYAFGDEGALFKDVKQDDASYEAIKFVHENRLMNGTGEGIFDPNATLTRAMLVTILGRLANEDMSSYNTTSFNDVVATEWYGPYVAWAKQKGIVNGYNDQYFGVDDAITREQLAAIFYRYGKMYDSKFVASDTSLVVVDIDEASDYAIVPLKTLILNDMLSLDSKNCINPKRSLLRSEAAMALMGLSQITMVDANKIIVHFEMDGGSQVKSQVLNRGDRITEPVMPWKEGYIFLGWYSNKSENTRIDFSKPIEQNTTIFAKWQEKGGFTNKKSSATRLSDTFVPAAEDTSEDTIQPSFITRAEWLNRLVVKHGVKIVIDEEMTNYSYADIEGNQYVNQIQAAHEYGWLPTPKLADAEQDVPLLYPDKKATREFVAYTTIKSMGYTGDYTIDTNNWFDWNETMHKAESAIAVQQGYMLLSNRRFQPQATISNDDINLIFSTMDRINAMTTMNTSEFYNRSTYTKQVVELDNTSATKCEIEEGENGVYTIKITSAKNIADISSEDIIILSDFAQKIIYTPQTTTKGAITTTDASIVLPLKPSLAYKVISTEVNGEQLVLTATLPELAEVYTTLDFISNGEVVLEDIVTAEGVSVSYTPSTMRNLDMMFLSRSIIAGGSTSLRNDLVFSIDKSFSDKFKVKGSFSLEVPDITCKLNANLGLFNTSLNELLFTFTTETATNLDLIYEVGDGGRGKEFNIASIPVPLGNTGLTLEMGVYLKVELDGTLSVKYKIIEKRGIHYFNGSLRVIKEANEPMMDIALEGSFGVGIGTALRLKALQFFDIVDLYLETGAKADATVTNHLPPSRIMTCIDAALYAYASMGIDAEMGLGKVLKSFNLGLEWEIYNKDNSPLRKNLHFEDFRHVDTCTLGHGSISGVVNDNDTKQSIQYARVKIYKGGALIKTLYTNTNGAYSLKQIDEGRYRAVISATGYYTYTHSIEVKAGESVYSPAYLMVERINGNVAGKITLGVRDALTGNKISGFDYKVREGWGNLSSDFITRGSVVRDSLARELPVGNYTIELSKSGYSTTYVNIAISAGIERYEAVVMSPVGLSFSEDTMRIVLTWGEHPHDIDSHLIGPTRDGSSLYHISYFDKDYHYNGTRVSFLDIDDVTSYGPETTTVYNLNDNGIYKFGVHDYTNLSSNNSKALSNSGAVVNVYLGDQLMQTYHIPMNKYGTYWDVFEYDAGTKRFKAINVFKYTESVEVK